jgi:outer membrane lipoprotein-sorting protein
MESIKFFTGILLITLSSYTACCQDAMTITHQMFTTVKALKTVKFDFNSKERIKGKMYNEITSFKININPFKAYIFQNFPKKGIEGLYVTGENGGKMKINPNSFPWVSLNLDPEGELMLENRHHPIYNAGFTYTISILEDLVNKYQALTAKMITYNGIVKIQGLDCYYLTLTNPNYRMTIYYTQPNETPISIAKKLKINYYTILENNPGNKASTEFKPGTRLLVPNDYASRMELYVHVSQLYPLYLKIYDPKGLFEEFTFSNVSLNPSFRNIDFSHKNPEYHF